VSVLIAAPARVRAAAPARLAALRVLIRRGLLDNRRTPLVWGGPIGVMSALIVALYPSIRGSLTQLVDGYPAGLKDAFAITDLGTLEAFLNAEMFSLLLPMATAYCAMRCVAAALAGAEESGYLDALLATPVTRGALVMSAFVTAAIVAAAVLALAGALTGLAAAFVGEAISTARLAGALAGVWALAVFFAGCATLAAGMLRRASLVLGAGGGTLVAMYLLDVLGKLADAVEPLRGLSAFSYYGAPLQDGLNVPGFALLVAVGLLLAVLGAVLHERRDLAA